MKVIKKDGRLQDFDEKKIRTSIENASRDIQGLSFNESDINIIVEDIKNKLMQIRRDGSPSSTYEIIGVLTEVLSEDGFGVILESFIKH
jgi:transcriptional regulator NrdR family protein